MKSRPPSSTRARVAALLLWPGLSLLAPAPSAAQARGEPRLAPRPEAAAFAALPESPGWEDALRLALWASGDDGSAAYETAAAAVREIAAAASALDERARADAVLGFLHRRFFRAYSERQTRVDAVVSSGVFNCVSSAVLYLVAGTAAGLEVSGVVTRDHAFCAVRAGGELVDVETTNPYGFDPGSRKEFHDSFGRITGYAYASPRQYRDRTAVGGKELVSLILSNRVGDLEAAGRFSEAVGLAVDRYAVLGGAKAREELVGRLVNYGARLAKSGDEASALDWARTAIAAYGPHRLWDELTRSAANNLLVKLLAGGQLPRARAEFEALSPLLDARARRESAAMLTEAELAEAAEEAPRSGDFSRLTLLAEAARREGAVPAARVREIEVYAALKASERAAASAGWLAALAEVERASARLGQDPKLRDAARAYRSNRIAELHNVFAALFNAKRFAEARDAAAAASAEFPGEARLRADLETAERALRSAR